MGLKYFFNDYIKICDRWILADNSHPPFKVVAEGFRENGEVLVRDGEIFGRIKETYETGKITGIYEEEE